MLESHLQELCWYTESILASIAKIGNGGKDNNNNINSNSFSWQNPFWLIKNVVASESRTKFRFSTNKPTVKEAP
ncbi:hypothetical protein P5673_009452 [Acropora cervicornis]|uniref:Uncharacterized protein n=1 Tax=Acropora cervicornis TaxID=6130 RepID=A0AAD9QSM8_ACRCE|nr:hypothetical protein P5673_009452 [Acropora cervicornis]